ERLRSRSNVSGVWSVILIAGRSPMIGWLRRVLSNLKGAAPIDPGHAPATLSLRRAPHPPSDLDVAAFSSTSVWLEAWVEYQLRERPELRVNLPPAKVMGCGSMVLLAMRPLLLLTVPFGSANTTCPHLLPSLKGGDAR